MDVVELKSSIEAKMTTLGMPGEALVEAKGKRVSVGFRFADGRLSALRYGTKDINKRAFEEFTAKAAQIFVRYS